MILSIHNFNGQRLVTHQHKTAPNWFTYSNNSPSLQSNATKSSKDLTNKLQSPNYIVDKTSLL